MRTTPTVAAPTIAATALLTKHIECQIRRLLAYNVDYENIDLVAYLREVIDDLEIAVDPCKIDFEAPGEIQFAANRAILVALIINKLVLNAGRHAYPDSHPHSPGRSIWVRVARTEGNFLSVSVRDEGVGLPAQFDPTTSKRFGTRVVSAVAKQLEAELTRPSTPKGSNFALLEPAARQLPPSSR